MKGGTDVRVSFTTEATVWLQEKDTPGTKPILIISEYYLDLNFSFSACMSVFAHVDTNMARLQ